MHLPSPPRTLSFRTYFRDTPSVRNVEMASIDAPVDANNMVRRPGDVDSEMEPGIEGMDIDPPADPDVEMMDAEPVLSELTAPIGDLMEIDEGVENNEGVRVSAAGMQDAGVAAAGAQRAGGNAEATAGEPAVPAQARRVVLTAELCARELRIRVEWR
ncbi:hypothetical protein EVG20_g10451 [Dentipellis fragilis]|uniref:Uncharacterized protein n=1 Tax=Dentipellis fragilis TaxID=205917 RepID=A0A4Y9XTD3_9AGAM|nr:hypothetical protein EVG20_g10451 [Dentipellis fragilis]